jgi:hypothetical protein
MEETLSNTSVSEERKIRWKWGVLAAIAITLLSLYPQLHLWMQLGSNTKGVYAYFDTDEVAYSAYLQALIDGRPRRNDPYIGRDDGKETPLPESLFSVQFVSPYLAAIPARLFGLSASTVFIILMPLIAAASALALFWVLASITHDHRLSAIGVLAVLCLATLVSGQGPVRSLFKTTEAWGYLPFLRRYIPAIPFPFFVALFGIVWRTTLKKNTETVGHALAAGLVLLLLIFSYFYLWTAALAWFACLSMIWLVARPAGWKRTVRSFGITWLIAISGLVPYLLLLSHRATNTDQVQVLVRTRRPDLFRPSEVCSFILLAVVVRLLLQRRLSIKDPGVLFLISLLLLAPVVFNQQIITGISLQPFHYEEFVTSYCVLIAAIIGWRLLFAESRLARFANSERSLFWIAIICIAYGVNSASGVSRAALNDNAQRDETIPAAVYLKGLSRSEKGTVFLSSPEQADAFPTLSSQPVLWAVHMSVFPGSKPAELKERFYQYLYFSGATEQSLRELLVAKNHLAFVALFGYEREIPAFAKTFTPVSEQEINNEVRLYADYINSFGQKTAARYPLSYAVLPSDGGIQNSTLSKWYELNEGERFGSLTVYRLTLKP